MFKNYFYLSRATTELKPILQHQTITDAYSQEKDKLNFLVASNNFPNRHLIISCNSTIPFVLIKTEHHKAKKNIIHLFAEYLPAQIRDIKIAENDRIVKLFFDKFSLYYLLRGSKSNVLLVNSANQIKSFKKISESDEAKFISELPDIKFVDAPQINLSRIEENLEFGYATLKKYFPFIDKIFFNQLSVLCNQNSTPSQINDGIINTIKQILVDPIAVFYSSSEQKAFFVPDSFKISKDAAELIKTDIYNQAMQNLFRIKFSNEKNKSLKNLLSKFFNKELKRLSNKLNNLKSRIDKGSREAEYYLFGNILLTNLSLLKKGMKQIELPDLERNSLVINLDEKKSPQQNIDKYFEKARDEKIGYKKSCELYKQVKEEYNNLLDLSSITDKSNKLSELQEIKEKLKISSNQPKSSSMEEKIKLRHYLLEGKYHIFIGRDGKSNDLLSTKFAKQNDYWFHTRGLPGSHVVLRVENKKEITPKYILKSVASIAAYYSKAKTAKIAPVAYTFGKYVYKRKGMEPGKVMISKEKVLLVKPEIPKNCELVEE